MSGPGRYRHNRDPRLAELLHKVTEEGWGNDSVSDLDEDGFHASLLIVEPSEQQELTEAFDRDVPAGNWILTQDPEGFITVDQYPTPAAARHAFEHLPDSGGPGEEDGTVTPAGTLGSRYAVALAGSFVGYADDLEQAIAMMRAAMDADRFWPDAWFISDHSNPPPPQPLAAVTRRRNRWRTVHGHSGGASGQCPARWLTSACPGLLGVGCGRPPPVGSSAGTGWVTRPGLSPFVHAPPPANPPCARPRAGTHRPVDTNRAVESR